MIHLDHNASTPLVPAAAAAMLPWLGPAQANASSMHAAGQAARAAVDSARRAVAALVGAEPGEVVFTSSGSEADALGLIGCALARRTPGRARVVVSAIEHEAVLAAADFLAALGFEPVRVAPEGDGRVDPERFLAAAIDPGTAVAALIAASNETGVVQPVPEVAASLRAHKIPLLTDAVQAVGRTPVRIADLGADLVALSAHKLGGPQGVGALIIRRGTPLTPLPGGAQEGGRRGGTEAVAAIAGFGAAAKEAPSRLGGDSGLGGAPGPPGGGARGRLPCGRGAWGDGAAPRQHPGHRVSWGGRAGAGHRPRPRRGSRLPGLGMSLGGRGAVLCPARHGRPRGARPGLAPVEPRFRDYGCGDRGGRHHPHRGGGPGARRAGGTPGARGDPGRGAHGRRAGGDPALSRGLVVVAMSGGVDSAVAAALLRDQGYEVIGATLKLWCHGETPRTGRTCCSLDDIADARGVAARLGIRHYVLDMQEDFATHVVEPFVAAYLAGETPNPCVACNTELKFGELARFASQLGAEFIATGHHARRSAGPDGEAAVERAMDRAKDQSYVLWGVPAEVLARVLLPVGELTKSEVRAAARELGLEVAEKRDSQDICFVTKGRYADFVRARAGAEIHPGPILDEEGRLVGQHAGIVDFTVGQRRGLKLGGGERSYVTAIDATTATVRVGPRAALATRTLRLRGVNWQRRRPPAPGESFLVQVRSSAEPVRAVVEGEGEKEGRRLRLALETPIVAAVRGQSGALYEGERLAGGGILDGTGAV